MENNIKIGLFDMFDKLDDIIYAPVNMVCNWAQEPLKVFEHKRRMKEQQLEVDHALLKERTKQELLERDIQARDKSNREAAKLDIDIRRWNAEIDQMISEQDDARRDRLVEALKRYQIDLANASTEIANSIGIMSIELRERANGMLLEKTKEYMKLQEEAQNVAMNRLEEIQTRFANNERMRMRMEDSVINSMDSVVDAAGRFITELSDDLKRLNQNTDELMRLGIANTNKYLEPMAGAMGVNLLEHSKNTNKKYLE